MINDFFVSNISKRVRKSIINFYHAGTFWDFAILQDQSMGTFVSASPRVVLTFLRPLNGTICSKFPPSVCCCGLFSRLKFSSRIVLLSTRSQTLPRPLEPPPLRSLSGSFLSKFPKYFILEPNIHIWLTMDDFLSIVITNL